MKFQILARRELSLKPVDLDWYIQYVSNVIVSVNLEHKQLKPPQHQIIKRDKIEIAILGYTIESSGNTNFYIKNIVQSLNDKVKEITLNFRRIRLIVAAGCVSLETAKEIATKTSSIHIVLSSCSRKLMWHDDHPPKDMYRHGAFPLKINNRDGSEVLVCHNFGTNQFLGELDVTLNEEGKINSTSGKIIHINNTLEENAALADLLKNEPESSAVFTVRTH